jgi:DNA replication protein DnaC
MDKVCNIHGIELESFNNIFNGTISFCPECKKEKQRENEEKEEKERKKRIIDSYKLKRIEPMYFDKTFDSFDDYNDELKEAKQSAIDIVNNNSGKLIMIGKNGTGKTHLAIAALKHMPGEIYTMFEISSIIRNTYTGRGDKTELDILDDLSSMKLLIIDEIGRSKGSDSERNWLSYIIDKRHVRNLPLIIISNRHLKRDCQVDGGCDKCLEQYLDSDMISRLVEGGKILTFTGKDHRRK